jgi:surface antigen
MRAGRIVGVMAAVAVGILGLTPVADAAGGYPYAHASVGQLDPWNFTTRQCTSYVAWRLHQAGDSTFDNDMVSSTGRAVEFGNANHWAVAARQLGDRVSRTPAVGAVAQWNSFESSTYDGSTMTASAYGHVAYVTAVHSDGSVSLAQYDVQHPRGFSTERIRAPRYLYIGPTR